WHDVVILALPHGASGPIAAELEAAGSETLVLDCGADHRLADAAAWTQFYGTEHAGAWPYGLPELILADGGARQREVLTSAQRIAVPGCNVTAVTLGMQPGIAAGVVQPTDLVAVLANGYSRAGKALKPHLLAAEGLGSTAPYAVGGSHRHIPEIEQNLRAAGASEVSISFTPTLVPMARGILATTTARLTEGTDPATVRAAWESAYSGDRSCSCCPRASGRPPPPPPAPTPPWCRSPWTSGSAGWSLSARSTTWSRAPPVPPCSP